MTYEIINTEHDTSSTHKVERTLVKLSEPTICRGSNTFDLYEVDHVLVEALRIVDDGVVYEETHVVGSDENATQHPAVLYLGTKALTVHEAMFAIGEHNFTDFEPVYENGETENG